VERRRWLPLRRSSITRLPRTSVRGNSIAIPQRRSPGCRFTRSISFYLCWPLNKCIVTTHIKSNQGNYVSSRKIRLECRKCPVFRKKTHSSQLAYKLVAATDVTDKQEGQTFQETDLIGIVHSSFYCCTAENTHTVLRPLFLAWYIAASAFLSNVSSSLPCSG